MEIEGLDLNNDGDGNKDLIQDELYVRRRHGGESSVALDQRAQLGVLKTLATVSESDEAYRQLLLLGAFESKQDAFECVAAIQECEDWGVPIKPILNSVAAQCGVKGNAIQSRVQEILMGLTHFNVTQTHATSKDYEKQYKGQQNELMK